MRSFTIAIVLLIWPLCTYAAMYGEESRERVVKHNKYTPSIGIVYANFEINGRKRRTRCTGALISDKHVITAGHCVYEKKYGFAKDIAFLPAMLTEDRSQNRRFFIETIWILKRFLESAKQSEFPNFDSNGSDIAVLEINSHLDKPPGDIYGYQGISYLNKDEEYALYEAVRHEALFYSYPDDKQDRRSLWKEQGCETWLSSKYIYKSQCDTCVGASGGALFFKSPYSGNYKIFGINSTESEHGNFFSKITKGRFLEVNAIAKGDEEGLEQFVSRNIDSSPYFSISLKNVCHRPIYVALNYKSLERKNG